MEKATYTKLRDGSWGVRIVGDEIARENIGCEMAVEVVKKSGERKDENVAIIWVGKNKFGKGDCALCKIISSGNNGGNYRGRNRKGCAYCGENEDELHDGICADCHLSVHGNTRYL